MLLDTASLYFRAFFGVPDTRAADGTPVNAVRGLLEFIATLVSQYQPTHLVCCWDNSWRPTWRVELIDSYKSARVGSEADGVAVEVVPDDLQPQIPIILDVLAALGIAVIGADDHEADDVIGTLSTMATGPVAIVTGDRDLFQLVDDARNVRVLYTTRGVAQHDRVDDAWILAKYGVHAAQYADFATLRGDASDGLPGVRGIGEKTAATLLQTYGDLAGIQSAAQDPATALSPSVRSKILAGADYLEVAPTVVGVARTLPLSLVGTETPSTPHDPAVLQALTQRYDLGSPVERVVAAITR
ncbi:5'-3' exonuclease [Nocardioides baekrokdamisoli]|uniref:5'-3' exonuclease n=2 Tax=Nocardioides baekrokdamisoli TaxID=1804624 RepID=A0A3G9IZ73_9ACTN|nr:5'-3' exonuclease [Nocardioides baekrokdamisoli]BBH16009.1 5'-3' exonuclease [Nocardioides baekrokdamisoli]